jgi:hypothetical protein
VATDSGEGLRRVATGAAPRTFPIPLQIATSELSTSPKSEKRPTGAIQYFGGLREQVLERDGNPGDFGRGMCALARGRHGQWVRGSARLAASGRVDVMMGLETDSTAFGMGGIITFDLLDATGKVLASGSTAEAAIPGKSPAEREFGHRIGSQLARLYQRAWSQK